MQLTVICQASVKIKGGMIRTLLRVEPLSEINGEAVTLSVLAERGELEVGKAYPLTIGDPLD
jgi:hypothetical protein